MNSGGYIKFILTLIAVLIAWFGYLAIQSVDRLRTSNLKVAEKLDALNEKIASGAMAAAVPARYRLRRSRKRRSGQPGVSSIPARCCGGRLIQTRRRTRPEP